MPPTHPHLQLPPHPVILLCVSKLTLPPSHLHIHTPHLLSTRAPHLTNPLLLICKSPPHSPHPISNIQTRAAPAQMSQGSQQHQEWCRLMRGMCRVHCCHGSQAPRPCYIMHIVCAGVAATAAAGGFGWRLSLQPQQCTLATCTQGQMKACGMLASATRSVANSTVHDPMACQVEYSQGVEYSSPFL